MRDLTTLDIGGKTYGVDLRHLREVVEQIPSTPIPLLPPVVRGVINLRGDLIPVLVLDEWLELGTPDGVLSRRPWMAILDFAPFYFGVLVDRVNTAAFTGEIESPPAGQGQFLEGIAKTELAEIRVLRIPSLIRHLEACLKLERIFTANSNAVTA